MLLLRLLEMDSRSAYRGILLITSLAGLGNAVLIGLINHVAELAAHNEPITFQLLLLYICAFAFFYIANRASLKEANRLVQERLGELRLRVAGKIRKSPLRALERVGHGELFAVFAQEINHLSQDLPLLVSAAQNAFVLVFILFYIATVSLPSFIVLTAFTALGLFIFWRRRVALNRDLAKIYHYEAAMLDSMASFTEGFQEIRLNADKNDALFRSFTGVVSELETAVVGIGARWLILLQFSNAFLYAMVGVVIFVLPIFFQGYTDSIFKIAAAAIFCVGPITTITGATHIFAKAEIGLRHVHNLEQMLDQAAGPDLPLVETSRYAGFRRIDYEGIAFSYRDAEGQALFTSGPWDLTLHRGEVLFLTGGNGSGKSTAMKLMCGLYAPDAGRILVDGEPVTEQTTQEFRECFSAIFPDFHLFDRLHGLVDVDPAQVAILIERMELADKVTVTDGRFSTVDLSTGQRKRLAMIGSLLEDREIYFFDEWAADQDAHFRDAFYTEILADLKQRGKTVVAITHDDRYWTYCDRRIVLDLGSMQPGSA